MPALDWLLRHLARISISAPIRKLEKQQRRQRQDIFRAEDEIMEKRDGLIDSLERRLAQKTEAVALFTIQWAVE